jgi:3-hydroxyisobutyrate dehydrogenase-like beta-hydroxyacid dehydrogenase
MTIKTIGVMSPGDMGQAVAHQLRQKGYTVHTALDRRSDRSKVLAREAGLTDVGSIERLTASCDVILSIMNPAAALGFAQAAAGAIAAGHGKPLFVDCNAIAPATMQAVDAAITGAGARCVDGSIVGAPPRGSARATLYFSGADAPSLEELATPQLRVRVLGLRSGDASSLKMCYGAMNKGITALMLETLMAARRLGVEEIFETQMRETRADVHDWLIGAMPVMPPKAYRWVPEMLQIAQTFEGVGMTPRIFQGAADMYELVAGTALGRETPEGRDKSLGGKEVIRRLADGK